MHADSRGGALPLADALIEWSDSLLVDAIRRAEAAVSPATLSRYGRSTLDEMRSLRRPPNRYRTPAFADAAVVALDRAWDRLFGTFRLAVERGEFVLDGFPALSFGSREEKRLPSDRAAEFVFDPPAGAVFIALETYVGVRVSRRGESEAGKTAGTANADADGGPALRSREASAKMAERSAPPEVELATDAVEKARSRSGRRSMAPTLKSLLLNGAPQQKTSTCCGSSVRQHTKCGRDVGDFVIPHQPLKAAVRRHWDEIQAQVAKNGGSPVWTDLAHLLQLRMRGTSGDKTGHDLPRWDTIRTRLPNIYAAMLSEKAEHEQSAQSLKRSD